MPNIKPYRQSIAPEGQVGGQATGSDFGGPGLYQVGQAVENATQNAAQAMAILAHNQARNEASDADLKLTLYGMEQEEKIQRLKQAHKPGDPDFTELALTEFKAGLEKLKVNADGEDAYTTNYGKRIFATKEAHLAKQFVLGIGRAQAEVRGTDAEAKFQTLTSAYSNKVSTGGQYQNINPLLQEYEQSVRLQLHPDMPVAKREELLRQGKGVIANSAVDGFIRDNPRGAQQALQDGFLANVLTKDQTSSLLDKAQTGVHMQEAAARSDQERVVKATELAHVSANQEIGALMLKQKSDPNTYNPAQALQEAIALMKTKPILTRADIFATIGAYESDMKDAKSGSTQGNVDLDRKLFAKIAAGKMPDISEINAARAQQNHPISATQHEELVKEWNTARTPEGRSLQVDMDAALKSVEPVIMPKDLTGVLADPESGLRMAKLTHDVRIQIDKDRREGKNPYNRLNPDSSDYMFTKERLKQYVTPFLERIRKSAERLSAQPGLPKTSEGGTVPEFQRKAGESILDWKKRTGQ